MRYSRPEPLTREHVRDRFDCGDHALNDWPQRYALVSQAADAARVYVTAEVDSEVVVGYYALAAAQVVPRDAPARLGKGQPASRPIPAVLLTRLAVDLGHQGADIGRSLVQDAIARAVATADTVGVRAILVHAKDDELREWYAQFGFQPSPTDPLHMVLLMKDARRTLSVD